MPIVQASADEMGPTGSESASIGLRRLFDNYACGIHRQP
jgi:hypothetical protein